MSDNNNNVSGGQHVGSSSFNSRIRSFFSKISAPFVTSPTIDDAPGSGVNANATGGSGAKVNEFKFKSSSSSTTRLDRAGDARSRQQTASVERNARFKSSSATSLVKHEEKVKQKQTAQVVVKNDQKKVAFFKFFSNFLVQKSF